MQDLALARQYQMLSLGRSTAYLARGNSAKPTWISMRWIDALPLEHPFADSRMGGRMLRDMLGRDDHSIGRSVRIRQRYAGCAILEPAEGIQQGRYFSVQYVSGAYSAPPVIRPNCI